MEYEDGWFDVKEERKIEPHEYGVYSIWKKKGSKRVIKTHIVNFYPGLIYKRISDRVKKPKKIN
jgi:hypothetical protein